MEKEILEKLSAATLSKYTIIMSKDNQETYIIVSDLSLQLISYLGILVGRLR